MPLWHEAWPAKDTKAMARILPDIDRHVKAVSAAKLPGILRDKQAAWDAGVKQLQAGAEAYRAAVEKKDDEALLKAAERLHMDYEKLVRVVRPVTPRSTRSTRRSTSCSTTTWKAPAAHGERARAGAEGEDGRAERRRATRPPEGQGARVRGRQGRAVDAVAALVAAVDGKNEPAIKAAVERVHTDYENLEAIFN